MFINLTGTIYNHQLEHNRFFNHTFYFVGNIVNVSASDCQINKSIPYNGYVRDVRATFFRAISDVSIVTSQNSCLFCDMDFNKLYIKYLCNTLSCGKKKTITIVVKNAHIYYVCLEQKIYLFVDSNNLQKGETRRSLWPFPPLYLLYLNLKFSVT